MPFPSTSRGRRAIVVLALLQSSLALVSLSYAIAPPVAGRAPSVDVALGATTLGLALFTVSAVPRLGMSGLHTSLVAFTVVVALMVATRLTPQGQVAVAYALVLETLYVAFFTSPRSTHAHLVVMSCAFLAAVTYDPEGLNPLYVVIPLATMAMTGVVVSRLVSDQRTVLRHQVRLADHDPLTGLLNRRGIRTEAEIVRSLAERGGRATTVSIIDLDDFKAYNDTSGHAAGDALLTNLAHDWQSVLRRSDLLARIGGDEFLLVAPHTDGEGTAALVARMHAANPSPWSSGTTLWATEENLEAATARADAGLYLRKRTSKLTRSARARRVRGTGDARG